MLISLERFFRVLISNFVVKIVDVKCWHFVMKNILYFDKKSCKSLLRAGKLIHAHLPTKRKK